MNSQPHPPAVAEALAHADAVLHRYFTAEKPRHWPQPPQVTPVRRWKFSLSRRHLALAASVLFAFGCWWACGLSHGSVPERNLGIRGEGGSDEKASRPGKHLSMPKPSPSEHFGKASPAVEKTNK
jgi:hypothetical protein